MEAHINSYDIYQQCHGGNMNNGMDKLLAKLLAPHKEVHHPFGLAIELCLNQTAATNYFNNPLVRKAIHADTIPFAMNWSAITLTSLQLEAIESALNVTHDDKVALRYVCWHILNRFTQLHTHARIRVHVFSRITDAQPFSYNKSLNNKVTPLWRFLLKHGIPGVIYNGDSDFMCDFVSGQWAVESLQLPRKSAYAPWFIETSEGYQDDGGFVEEFQNLVFMTVKGAGHMVPQWKPIRALAMLQHYILDFVPNANVSTTQYKVYQ